VQPRRTPTDVVALARSILEQVDMLGHPVYLETEPIEFSVDAPMLERALENLVTNAARHTPTGTRVWVRLCREAGGLLVIVEDAGLGVPDDLKEAIFEPFRQGRDVPSHAPGVGIGLSLVMLFAKLHGGRAWVEDRPGGGASFRVLLPGDASGTQEHRE
jgi:signal transduction histidine kinase